MKVPEAVGVPEILIVSEAQVAVTPPGRPVAAPMPVAPVVLMVMVVRAALIQTVGLEEAVAAVFLFTVMVPVAFTVSQPPVSGIL